MYLRARYYNPAQGRFFQKDTWQGNSRRPQSLNGYAYAEGNPVLRTDPSGHDICFGNAWLTPVSNHCWPLYGSYSPPYHWLPTLFGPPQPPGEVCTPGTSTPPGTTQIPPDPTQMPQGPTGTPPTSTPPAPTETLDPNQARHDALVAYLRSNIQRTPFNNLSSNIVCAFGSSCGSSVGCPEGVIHCGVDIEPNDNDWRVYSIIDGEVFINDNQPDGYQVGVRIYWDYAGKSSEIRFVYVHVVPASSPNGSGLLGTVAETEDYTPENCSNPTPGVDCRSNGRKHLHLTIKDMGAALPSYQYINPADVLFP